jgi:hypothetical protein
MQPFGRRRFRAGHRPVTATPSLFRARALESRGLAARW